MTVNFENGTGINNVEMILTKVGSSSPMPTITGSGSAENQRKLTRENIESGAYNAEINFKSSSGELKYSTHEMVNVFQNLTTDTWSGSTSYLKGGQFLVTKARVDGFTTRKEFYVQGTSGTYTPTTIARDTNSGTYFDPFATIQKAVDTINAINDGTSAYTIKVDGTVEITSQSATSAVVIQTEKNLNLTIESHSTAKATVKANPNDKMRVFIVGNGGNTSITPNVTMKNLIITGGNNGTGGGAGIKLEAGNLTLSNVEVKDNKTTDIGGGIFVNNGDCNITGGAISNNKAASKGGGVCLAVLNSTIKISGTVTMSGNQLTSQQETGTAIYADAGATAELDGSSGNINITPAQGDAHPTIYLAKDASEFAIQDAVLKLGGNVSIGNGSGTGIKMEKTFRDTANIKITSGLTSTQIINISYDDAQLKNPIIESEKPWQLTQEDCDKFRVKSVSQTYKLTYDGSMNQGICAYAFGN